MVGARSPGFPRPQANVGVLGIGAVGLLFWWLGLGLMSRWLGTIQLGVGAVMLFMGKVPSRLRSR